MKKVIRLVLIATIAFIVGYGEYQIYLKGPTYAKPQGGIVLSAFESKGRSSSWFATVKFDNGDYQKVNTGHTEYKIGERFTSTLSWNPIVGVSGFAYAWNPGDWYIFATMPAILFNLLLLLKLFISIFVFALD
ncbi:hypothetical protein GO003_024885 [Methylicorpusculum oleiharenae]|uniref:hypothetical protein n=1 Tax=Methylicorpusculum oleiharenae TaxID=1338687 RepID=UPI00135CBB73|nr:hypothetical protein [Methylicorpusculum oleiharenae]MCD2453618.1 hypothetical protein [Methylicorpusculum oleiharenae]